MPDLEKLSAAKIEAEYERRFEHDSKVTKACVAGGLGSWYPRDRDAALQGDKPASEAELALCKAWLESSNAFHAVVSEMDRRKRYSGTLKPIKVAC